VFVKNGATWTPQAKLTGDSEPGDQFGRSVSISGDTAIVGAPFDTTDEGFQPGSAQVFGRDVGGVDRWGKVVKLTPLVATTNFFGFSVSISGDTAIVGAFDGSSSATRSGAAYVFGRDVGGADSWGQVARLTASDAATRDQFGFSVSISGDTAIVGADGDDDVPNGSGSAYVFVKPAGGWADSTQTAKLTASDAAANDQFGFSVSISGDTAIAGAHFDDDTCPIISPECQSGSAYVFVKPAGGWADSTQTAKLTASDADANDFFGESVSISGDTAIAGAINDEITGMGIGSGSAYVFVKPAGGWADSTQTAKLTSSDGFVLAQFGISVSISGDTAIVGAHFDDDGGSKSGSAYVFDISNFPPTASDSTADIIENTDSTINLVASDLEGAPLTFTQALSPSHATTFTFNFPSQGSVTYFSAPTFPGTDSFSFKANDGIADSNEATVTIESDGTLISPGDQLITVLDLPEPDGVRIIADPAGGPTAAQLSPCNVPLIITNIFPGANFELNCSSPTFKVIAGMITIQLQDAGGNITIITLDAGDFVTLDEALTITNNQDTPAIIEINGIPTTIGIGETIIIDLGPPDHYLGYKVKETKDTPKFDKRDVDLTDQFGSGIFEVKKPERLYNPVDKNGEGITDLITHLVGYKIELEDDDDDEVIASVLVTNQFGDIILDVEEEKFLLVPSAKDLNSPPSELGSTLIDHYKCYEVEVTDDTPKFEKREIRVFDPNFDEDRTLEVKKPKLLCNPVDKNGEGIIDEENHLLCYDVKSAKDEPKHEKRKSVFTNNQFGPEQLDTKKVKELCVPSMKTLLEAPIIIDECEGLEGEEKEECEEEDDD